ncbi:MAG: nucleotide exchange factor GrpE [Syntrophus sp. (in: bacteria)]|nr:nucleotide exchange factor GrpE [Syntrophus sp. (in: bacteria)]
MEEKEAHVLEKDGILEKKGKAEAHEEHKKKKKKEDPIEELEKVVQEKEAQIKELQGKMLYLQAEFENFKKLKVRERQETLKYGNETLLQEMIPIIDNLEMALAHALRTEDGKGIKEGVEITLSQFLKVLEKSGVERIEAIGAKFDPNLHEALYQEERDDVAPDTVVSEVQKGYLLNGRLVRPSRVCVSKSPEIQ